MAGHATPALFKTNEVLHAHVVDDCDLCEARSARMCDSCEAGDPVFAFQVSSEDEHARLLVCAWPRVLWKDG